jgi:protein-S-isoprenylcysteine O-methyltransferase Ste14
MALSVWLVVASIRALGKQWSVSAQIGSAHELITSGPYGWVRHPIYVAMGGLLLASGVAFSAWTSVLSGFVLYVLGTALRIRSEERLLQNTFGHAYEEYVRSVPAMWPRFY